MMSGEGSNSSYKNANANPNPNPIVVDLYHTALEKATSGGDTALSVVPMDLYWIWRFFWAERTGGKEKGNWSWLGTRGYGRRCAG